MNFVDDEKFVVEKSEGRKVKASFGSHPRVFIVTLFSLCLYQIVYHTYKNKSQEHTVLYWLESCGAVASCLVYSKLKKRSLRNVFSNLSSTMWPAFGIHALAVSGFCLDASNYRGHFVSGSMQSQICLSLAPSVAVFTKWRVQQEAVSRKSIAFTSIYTCLMLIAVCSNNEVYTPFVDGVFGLILASLLGSFVALIDTRVSKVSLFDIFYCLNIVTAITLLIISVASGEMGSFLEKMNTLDSILELVKTVCVVGFFGQLCLIACLWQISVSGTLLHMLTRNTSWIVRCIYVAVRYTDLFLPISSFKAMWITLISLIVYTASGGL